jgi:putative tricarboxylic transport membrane protein
MRRYGWPVAPAVIGVILGPLAEQQLRRALAIGQGDYGVLLDSPRAVVLFGIAAVVLFAPLVARIARRDRGLIRDADPRVDEDTSH